MPKLGYNLLAWSSLVTDDLLPILDRLHKIGYEGIEFAAMGTADPAAYRRLGAHARGLGLQTTAAIGLGPHENPVSPDAAVRRLAVDRLKWTVDRAVDGGATVICGPSHSAFATFTRDVPRADEYQRSAEVLREAGDYAKQAGVTFAVEALNRFECYLCNTMAQLRSLVELTGHPNIRAMFDTHHANIEEKSQGAAVREIAPVLVHVHLSENDRGTPGAGQVRWDEALTALAGVGYDGWMMVEAFTRADPGFANAINVWREFSPAWEIAEKGHAFLRPRIAAAGFRR
ncbi:MAG: sugar phosphate isomerase/epimerase [Opitutus sp.]|nr:sugar phosphate isomerase/epimerase [Opitutus sp.]